MNYETKLVAWYKQISTWAKLGVGFALGGLFGFIVCALFF